MWEISPRADNAHEHIDSGIRMGDRTVMLSTCAPLSVNSAKQLSAPRERPCAAAQGDKNGPGRETLRCGSEALP
jgi:hypothetical protein